MKDVAVIGIGMNKWGELWEQSIQDLFVEAALEAMRDAGIDSVDNMVIGCMSSGLFSGQEHLASLLADYLGTAPGPAVRVESACASGGMAVRTAFAEIAAGLSRVVLVGGVEKMTDVDTGGATFALSTAADQEYEVYQGITFPGLYAMMARAHMSRYGTTREQLARVAVKNHHHGSMNPLAQFPQEITVDQVIQSVMIADPLRILDCSPITDGAAALVLADMETAKRLGRQPLVKLTGIGQATDTIALHDRTDPAGLPAVTLAARQAYRMADRAPGDIDLVEVHDCFTIAEIMAIEALGLTEAGGGGRMTESGQTTLGGRIPVNVSGGLKAKGHPVGATGVAQVVELVKQLRGDAGQRQVNGARIGLAQNMGGSGGSAVVSILEVIS